MNFTKSFGAAFLVISVFSAAAACSSGDSGGSVAADSSSFISQLCAEYMPCCAKAGKPSDGAQCRAFYSAFTGSATYDAAAGSKCLEEVRAQKGSASFCDEGISAPSCEKAFGSNTGTKKPGEACSEDEECAPSAEGKVECASLFVGGSQIKKCQVQVTGKLGDTPCAGTVDGNTTSFSGSGTATDIPPKGYLCYVKDGLRCDSKTGACAAIAKVGEACEGFGSYLCTKDAYCDTTAKKCVARKAVGAACTGFSSEQCVEGAYCDSTTKACVASLAVGAPCKSSNECASGSCVNSACAAGGDLTTAFLCGG
jgi:hypothetical protein